MSIVGSTPSTDGMGDQQALSLYPIDIGGGIKREPSKPISEVTGETLKLLSGVILLYQGLLLHPPASALLVRGGLVCLNSAARFDKWNHAAVR